MVAACQALEVEVEVEAAEAATASQRVQDREVEEAEEAGVKLLSARRMGVVAAVVAVEEEG